MADDTPISVFIAGMSRTKLIIIAGICVLSLLLFGTIVIIIVVFASKDSGTEVGAMRHSLDKCPSGRLYLGDVNGAFPEYAAATGIYVETMQQPYWTSGLAYQHESRKFYIAKRRGHNWEVYNAKLEYGMELKTNHIRPDKASEQWSVRYGNDDDRAFMKDLKLTCLESSFATCHSGKLRISGMENRTGAFLKSFMGNYSLMNRLQNGRQLYRKDKGKGYLSYSALDERWGLDFDEPPDKQIRSAFIYTKRSSNAIRPEYIMNRLWFAFDFNRGKGFSAQPLRITCINTRRPAVHKMEPDLAVKRKERLPFYYFNNKYCRLTPASQYCSANEDCC